MNKKNYDYFKNKIVVHFLSGFIEKNFLFQ